MSSNLFDWKSEPTESKIVVCRIWNVFGKDFCDLHQGILVSHTRSCAHTTKAFFPFLP